MAVRIEGRYLGNKNVALKHVDSGQEIFTAAPLDNNGDGSSFSPTDLLAASLGACMVTVMGIVAEKRGIELGAVSFEMTKHMQSDPRKVASLPITISLPANLDTQSRSVLEKAANECPVYKSLDPDIDVAVTFVYV